MFTEIAAAVIFRRRLREGADAAILGGGGALGYIWISLPGGGRHTN